MNLPSRLLHHVAAALLIAATTSLHAQPVQWTQCGGPYTADVYAMAVSGHEVLTATNNNICRSTDLGATWTRLIGTPFFTWIGATDTVGKVFFGQNSYVRTTYRSTDSGATWVALPGAAHPWNAMIQCRNVLFGAADGLWGSLDSGATWSLIPQYPVTTVHTLTRSGDTLFAGGDQGLWRSINAGSSWTRMTADTFSIQHFLLYDNLYFAEGHPPDLQSSSSFLMSTDYGLSWNVQSQVAWHFGQLAGANHVLLGFDGGANTIARSIDSGRTWVKAQTGLVDNRANAFAVIDSVALCGTAWTMVSDNHSAGLHRSTNAGLIWNEVGLPNSSVFALTASRGVINAAIGQGLGRSADTGKTWSPSQYWGVSNSNYTIVQQDTMLFTALVGYPGKIYRSRDNGGGWNVLPETLTSGYDIHTLCATRRAILALDKGVNGWPCTTDLGNTWHALTTGFATTSNADYFFGLGSGGKSLNRGNADGTVWWTLTNLPDSMDLVLTSGNTGIVLAESRSKHFFRSTNNGDSWIPIPNLQPVYNSAGQELGHLRSMIALGRTLFIGRDNLGIYCSTDAGDSWFAVNSGLTSFAVSVFANMGTTLIAGTGDQGCFRADISGIPLRPVANVDSSTSICLGNDTIITASITDGQRPYKTEWRLANGLTIPSNEIVQLTDSTIRLRPRQTRVFRLTVADARGQCDTAFFTIIAHPFPNASVVQRNDTLHCTVDGDTTGAVYQWFEKTTSIESATNPFFVPAHSGLYSVNVTVRGCTSITTPVVFNISTVSESIIHPSQTMLIEIDPNPARDVAMVNVGGVMEIARLSVVDVLGRVCYQAVEQHNVKEFALPCGDWPSGMYVVHVQEGSAHTAKMLQVLH